MIENRQLQYFIAAAQYMNITRAAETLHITQPALTRNIHQIEEELGVALFRRANKRVSLTEAGESFLAEAKLVLQQLEHSVLIARKAARGEVGSLSIGFTSIAGLLAVPRLVNEFSKRYPDPMIALNEMLPSNAQTALRNSVVDVALLYGSPVADEFAVHTLESDHFMAALPRNHRFAKRPRVNLQDLAEDYFIMPSYATGGSVTDNILEECRLAGFRPRTGYEVATATIQTTLGLVSAGIGVSLIPSSLRPFQRKGVVFRPLSDPRVALDLNMHWRPQGISIVLRNFLRMLGIFTSTE